MASTIPDGLKYTAEHEWVEVTGDLVRIGITDHAQALLREIVYVDLPAPGADVTAGQALGEVESHKSVSDLFAPVSGIVETHNDALEDRPELINEDPYGEGWMLTIRISDAGELDALLSAEAYAALIAE